MNFLEKNIAILFPDKPEEFLIAIKNIIEIFNIENQELLSCNINFYTENDIMLSCSPDHVSEDGVKTLKTMNKFFNEFTKDFINIINFSSLYSKTLNDNSTTNDYSKINSSYGDWEDLKTLEKDFKFTFNYNANQVDLDFSKPEVFIKMIKTLLFLARNGAKAINLSPIAYSWKKSKISSPDLENVHALIQIIREIFNKTIPQVWLIAETDLPPKENTNFFGNGNNEAHIIYHYQLESLLLHTLLTEDSTKATKWLQKINPRNSRTSFLNIYSSLDDINLIATKEFLNEKEIEVIKRLKTKENRQRIKYENEKLIAIIAIQLSLRGIPQINFNNLIGDTDSNKEKYNYDKLTEKLKDKNSKNYKIYTSLKKLIIARKSEKLFSPLISQKVLDINHKIIAISRYKGKDKLLCLINISNEEIKIDSNALLKYLKKEVGTEIIRNQAIKLTVPLYLRSFQIAWIK